MKQNNLAVLYRSLHKRLFLSFDHGPSVDVIQSEVFKSGVYSDELINIFVFVIILRIAKLIFSFANTHLVYVTLLCVFTQC